MSALPKLSEQITYDGVYERNPIPSTPVNVMDKGTYMDARDRGLTWSRLDNICNQLKDSNGFTDVELTGNELDNGDLKIIRSVFDKIFENVECVSLSRNKLGPNVTKVLTEVLPKCKKMKFLYIFGTELSRDEIMSLKKACPVIYIQFE
jgi:hypothetical protein